MLSVTCAIIPVTDNINYLFSYNWPHLQRKLKHIDLQFYIGALKKKDRADLLPLQLLLLNLPPV